MKQTRFDLWLLTTVVSVISLIWAISSLADTAPPPKREVTQFKFGDTRIVRQVDPHDYLVEVYARKNLKARYPGVSFEHLAASKDNSLFVGVSNLGYPGSAVIIFGADGSLRGYVRHMDNRLRYCTESVSIIRHWYDRSNPDIRFEESQDSLFKRYGFPDITIKSCDGKRISISNLLKGDRKLGAIPTR